MRALRQARDLEAQARRLREEAANRRPEDCWTGPMGHAASIHGMSLEARAKALREEVGR